MDRRLDRPLPGAEGPAVEYHAGTAGIRTPAGFFRFILPTDPPPSAVLALPWNEDEVQRQLEIQPDKFFWKGECSRCHGPVQLTASTLQKLAQWPTIKIPVICLPCMVKEIEERIDNAGNQI